MYQNKKVPHLQYQIRVMRPDEYQSLQEFLYEAIFIPEGVEPVPFSIIEKPELQVYIRDFGTKKDDWCFCAVIDKKIVGAVWVRNINGYGSIDQITPEFAISILKDYRGAGIGTALMKQMIEHLKKCGYKKATLAVQKANYALRMYQHVGFHIIDENEQEYIMIHDLK